MFEVWAWLDGVFCITVYSRFWYIAKSYGDVMLVDVFWDVDKIASKGGEKSCLDVCLVGCIEVAVLTIV